MSMVAYARVSTGGQSIEAQLDLLRAENPVRIYQDTISGVKKDRPALVEMLDWVRGGDTVVVTKLDRVARSTRHLLEIVDHLKAKGVEFKVLNMNLDTGTATGKLMLTMLAGIAEFEREMMLERQAEGIAKAKQEGRYTGRKPTARAKTEKVLQLAEQGLTRQDIADRLGIGVASVYRIIKDNKTGS